MGKTLRNAFELLIKNPLLFIPLLLVEGIVLFLDLITKRAVLSLIRMAMMQHSVLSGSYDTPASYDLAAIKMFFLISGPLNSINFLIDLLVQTTGLILTIQIASLCVSGKPVQTVYLKAFARESWLKILGATGKLLLWVWAGRICLAIVAYLIVLAHRQESLANHTSPIFLFMTAISIIVASGVAYFLSPLFIHFVHSTSNTGVTRAIKSRVQVLAVLSTIASGLISYSYMRFRPSLHIETQTANIFLNYVSQSITEFPFLLFAIALPFILGEEPSIGRQLQEEERSSSEMARPHADEI